MAQTSPFFGSGPGEAAGGTLAYTVLDVFTSRPFHGNQLAVFTDARDLSAQEMQQLALEMNLSETVFLLPAEGDGDARARIFTPRQELAFAGHPVLGSAFVLAQALGTSSVSLETGKGTVPVEMQREIGRLVFGRMSQPLPEPVAFDRSGELLAALGIGEPELPVEAYENGTRHVYVALDSAVAVAGLRPDLRALGEVGTFGVNCFAGGGTRWKTRMFAPALGVAEDAATGSAAGPLAVHLARHGLIAYGDEIVIEQGAEMGRPSILHASAHGSAGAVTRVEVGGAAIVVAQGHYLVRSARST
ncbi:MAG: PhzF family phenazine biosynthesis protein [Acidimicrobiales bacterium]